MAILTSAANPNLRGTFITLNAAVQSLAIGVAAFVRGNIITRDSQGLGQLYWIAALVGACASLAAIWVAGRLDLHAFDGAGCQLGLLLLPIESIVIALTMLPTPTEY